MGKAKAGKKAKSEKDERAKKGERAKKDKGAKKAGAATEEKLGKKARIVLEAIRSRRSIRKYDTREVTREEVERILEAAVHAPNHRMTEPWRFYVLGAQARRAYGDVLGVRKAKKVEDAEAAALVRAKVASEHEALPCAIAVAMKVSDDAERQREDYAATFMAVQNLCLAAWSVGLGTHIKTGAVMDDAGARAAVGVGSDERIVAFVYLGTPEEIPTPRERTPASSHTVWRD